MTTVAPIDPAKDYATDEYGNLIEGAYDEPCPVCGVPAGVACYPEEDTP